MRAQLKINRKMIIAFLMIGVLGSFVAPTLALSSNQPLKTLRAREKEEKQLDQEAGFTGNVCGTNISTRIDWDSAQDWPESASITKVCDGALSALEAICRGDQSRGKKITSFVCAGDGAGPNLSGSTLRYGGVPGGNGFDDTKDYLEGKL